MKIFIEDIVVGSVLPAEIENKIKIERNGIPKSVREKLWYNYFGEGYRGICQCCGKTMGKGEYHTGHMKSSKNGGSDDISNLTPLCRTCNLSMGSENFDSFKNSFHSD